MSLQLPLSLITNIEITPGDKISVIDEGRLQRKQLQLSGRIKLHGALVPDARVRVRALTEKSCPERNTTVIIPKMN